MSICILPRVGPTMAVVKYCRICKTDTMHEQLGPNGDWCEVCDTRAAMEADTRELERFRGMNAEAQRLYLFDQIQSLRRSLGRESGD